MACDIVDSLAVVDQRARADDLCERLAGGFARRAGELVCVLGLDAACLFAGSARKLSALEIDTAHRFVDLRAAEQLQADHWNAAGMVVLG